MDAESMWIFAKNNEVAYHFIRKQKKNRSAFVHSLDDLIIEYTYEGIMSRDTYLAFRLAVPVKEAMCVHSI